MHKAAYIRINTPDQKLEEMGFTYSESGNIQKATNICTTSHKTYSCITCREDCGKDIERFLELCKDEMYEITKVPIDRFNK